MDYAALKTRATSLLKEHGAEVQIERTGGSTSWTRKFDPLTSRTYWEDDESNIVYTAPSETVSTTSGYAVFSNWKLSLVQQGVVQEGDVRVVLSVDLEVESGDILITAAGREFTILPPITRMQPDETTRIVQVVNARGQVST